NTTGDVLNEAQQDAMERFIAAGKGFVGIHSAADTEYNWDWYEEAIGAHFDNHPEIQSAQLIIEDRVHPATSHLDLRWERTDEWYAFRRNPRGDVHVLISLNEQSYSGGTMGYDHPWAWCNETAGGRIFYTGGGHTTASYSEEAFRAHLLGGLEWAAGAVSGDCGATQSGNFEKTILDDDTRNPLDLVVLPTGEVLYLERGGQVRSIDPDTGISSTVLERTVDLSNEDGLLGIVLDPFFDQNSWIYLFYSPPGDPSYQQVSRFTWTGDRLDPSSEVSIIQIPVDREECCHSAGSMVFDPDGNLLIATGDNTNPFDSDGYTPIDDRQGRPYW
ncbi:MAG: ThuA domain-containing protein, partial [Bacteroidota bacterium]|nr:ThuA domain-containing protein [Bacteroidota bacterium]